VTDSFVHYAAADRIVTLTMNRPDSRNAIGEEAVEAFLEKREPRFTGQ
jgi:enoyl-CoA hydratase/carnithine racemase